MKDRQIPAILTNCEGKKHSAKHGDVEEVYKIYKSWEASYRVQAYLNGDKDAKTKLSPWMQATDQAVQKMFDKAIAKIEKAKTDAGKSQALVKAFSHLVYDEAKKKKVVKKKANK